MHLELWIPPAGRMRFTLLPVILGAAIAMVPCVATAGTIQADKFIIWDFNTAPDDNAKGTFGWILKAKVDDNPELKSDSSKNWKLKDGLPDDIETSGQAGPTSKGSSAKSDMTFFAKPDTNANAPFNSQYDADINTKVQADTAKDKGGSASASSVGSMNIPGGKITAVSKFDPTNRNGKVIDTTKFSGFGATTEGKGSWHDPISLNFLDLTTNQLLTEDLLGMELEILGVGAMSWDSNGFSLSAPSDGSSSVSFNLQVLSSWITDPTLVSSTLSLSNGNFQATGVFAGLPWAITPGQVSLPAGLLDSISIPYQIPLGTFNSTDDYFASLTLTEGAQVSDGVPEPSYAVLLAIAVAALVARARRTPPREAAETPYIVPRADQETASGSMQRKMILPAIFAAATTLIPGAARATTIEATKTIKWTIGTSLPKDTDLGTYGWNLHAVVDGLAPVDLASPTGGKTWKLLDGLPKDSETTKLVGPSTKGSTAQADIDFTASKPVESVLDGYDSITAVIHTKVQADAGKDGSAEATSSGSMKIASGLIVGAKVKGAGQSVEVDNVAFRTDKISLGGNAQSGFYHDPISLSFLDVTTNELLTQDLLAMDMEPHGGGAMSWDSNGFSLTAPVDGFSSASFQFQVLSSWITDPTLVNSSLSLSSGIFQATGIFASLPWVIAPETVTLPGGVLSSISIPYQVPSNLINVSDMYAPSLTLTEGAQVSDGVPEPSYTVLLVIAVSAMAVLAPKSEPHSFKCRAKVWLHFVGFLKRDPSR